MLAKQNIALVMSACAFVTVSVCVVLIRNWCNWCLVEVIM